MSLPILLVSENIWNAKVDLDAKIDISGIQEGKILQIWHINVGFGIQNFLLVRFIRIVGIEWLIWHGPVISGSVIAGNIAVIPVYAHIIIIFVSGQAADFSIH